MGPVLRVVGAEVGDRHSQVRTLSPRAGVGVVEEAIVLRMAEVRQDGTLTALPVVADVVGETIVVLQQAKHFPEAGASGMATLDLE